MANYIGYIAFCIIVLAYEFGCRKIESIYRHTSRCQINNVISIRKLPEIITIMLVMLLYCNIIVVGYKDEKIFIALSISVAVLYIVSATIGVWIEGLTEVTGRANTLNKVSKTIDKIVIVMAVLYIVEEIFFKDAYIFSEAFEFLDTVGISSAIATVIYLRNKISAQSYIDN